MSRNLRWLVLAAALALAPSAFAATPKEQLRALQEQALAAYKAGNFAACAKGFAAALAIRPHHPRLIYNVAACSAKAGATNDAIAALNAYADMGLIAEAEKDDDFASLRGMPAFKAVLAKIDANRAPIGTSSTIATITGAPFLAEGIAFDPATKRFFVSSVDQRKIVQISRDGAVSDFVTSGRDGLLGAFGMAVDPKAQLLWVASSGMTHVAGVQPVQRGAVGMFGFSLADGRLVRRTVTAASKPERVMGDLFLGPDGVVYATDSVAPLIYAAPSNDAAGLSKWLRSDAFVSLQGMTTTPDGKSFIVADYAMGLHVVDRTTKSVETISFAGGTTLLGIDGLYRTGNTLLAVQNGVNPQRILALTLGATGRTIDRVQVLSANDPNIPEPSLGALTGDKFCVVANAQWSHFKDDGTRDAAKPLAPARIACIAAPVDQSHASR